MVARHPFVGHRAAKSSRNGAARAIEAVRSVCRPICTLAALSSGTHRMASSLRSRSRHASRSPVAENRAAHASDWLWLTVVVGLAVGWWGDRNRLEAPLAKLAEYERAEQIAKRKQDEKRLRDLEWKLAAFKSVTQSAPSPADERPKFTAQDFELMVELQQRLSLETSD